MKNLSSNSKRTIIFLCISIIMGSLSLHAQQNNTSDIEAHFNERLSKKQVIVKAKVIDISFDDTKENRPNVPIESDFRRQDLKIKLRQGKHKGEIYTIKNQIAMIMPYKMIFDKGDSLLVVVDENRTGKITNLTLYERNRSESVYALIFLFIAALLLVGRKQGLKSLIGLAITITLIFTVFFPLITHGYSPLLASLIVCVFGTIATLLIIAGFNRKSISAMLGTLAGTLIAMLFAYIAGKIAHISGLGSDEAQMLAFVPSQRDLNYQSILFAGIAIGALGAVMDTSLSISSSLHEILEHKPAITIEDLAKSGMTIGKDIIGSMSNTLILAYVSTSIPFILLSMLFKTSPAVIINIDQVAGEILRAVAGSIGLILTIPATVYINCAFIKKYRT